MQGTEKNHHLKRSSDARTVLDVIGSKWAISIICALQQNTLRSREIQRMLPGTRQKVLTHTLRKLERGGIVDRKVYPTVPPQVEYKLTPVGLDLLELSGVLSDWVEIHEEEIKRAQQSYDRRNR